MLEAREVGGLNGYSSCGYELPADPETIADMAHMAPPAKYRYALKQIPVLRAEEETMLADVMEAGTFAREILAGRRGDTAARHEVVAYAMGNPTKADKLDIRRGAPRTAYEAGRLRAIIEASGPLMLSQTLTRDRQESPMPSDDELEQLVADGIQAEEVFVRHNLRLLAQLASRYENSRHTFDELMSAGYEELVRLVRAFDGRQGIKFSTFAFPRLGPRMLSRMLQEGETLGRSHTLRDAIGKLDTITVDLTQQLNRTPSGEELVKGWNERTRINEAGLERPITLQGICAIQMATRRAVSIEKLHERYDDAADSWMHPIEPQPDDFSTRGESDPQLRAIIFSMWGTMRPRSREIATERLLYEGRRPTLEEIARKYSMSKQNVSRIEQRALQLVRNATAGKTFKDVA